MQLNSVEKFTLNTLKDHEQRAKITSRYLLCSFFPPSRCELPLTSLRSVSTSPLLGRCKTALSRAREGSPFNIKAQRIICSQLNSDLPYAQRKCSANNLSQTLIVPVTNSPQHCALQNRLQHTIPWHRQLELNGKLLQRESRARPKPHIPLCILNNETKVRRLEKCPKSVQNHNVWSWVSNK